MRSLIMVRRSRGRAPRLGARGIVTIEFACGILASIIVMIMLGWAIFLFGVKIGLIDAAGQIARQAARGDHDAVRAAEKGGPAGADYQIRSSPGSVRVEASVDARPLAGMPGFRLSATAVAVPEPGIPGVDR